MYVKASYSAGWENDFSVFRFLGVPFSADRQASQFSAIVGAIIGPETARPGSFLQNGP